MKSGLINFVVSSLPGLPDGFREGLKKVLNALVNYGLASLNIPSELLNFDALEKDGLVSCKRSTNRIRCLQRI
ncbi:MAG: hypothetical protein ACP5SP_04740 [Caldisericum sp.]